jgi:hypothetical protein
MDAGEGFGGRLVSSAFAGKVGFQNWRLTNGLANQPRQFLRLYSPAGAVHFFAQWF